MSAKSIACGSVVAAAVVLSGLGAGAAGASATAGRARQPAGHAAVRAGQAAVPGTQLWVQRYSPGNGYNGASSVAVSPAGGTVFVTGTSYRKSNTNSDYATVAYNAATGAQRWARRYNGPGNRDDHAYSVAVSPGGGTVYVTGTSGGIRSGADFATVAYNAATGAQRWVKRYNGSGNRWDGANSVAVSPGGDTVFVTGYGYRKGAAYQDYVTVAYNPATGAQRWVRRYHGPGNGNGYASSVAVSPGGGTVFVTGVSPGISSWFDFATVAYNAATGAQRWVRRYNGPGNGEDRAQSVAVSPTGGTVYVTGISPGISSWSDFATVAYDAATGAQRWVKRYNGPGNGMDGANSVAVSPGGGTVYVTGSSDRKGTTNQDYTTVAYNAATGAQRWVTHYNGPGNGSDLACSVAVSPTGDKVFITGESEGIAGPDETDYATVAYSG